MISVRAAGERGRTRLGWLDSQHTFSFGDYHDPGHMGFRVLRVINEDVVQPGQGFGAHGHRDMEIVTWVLEGALEHRDSLGSGGVLRPGEVQCMSAGTGITHSELNASKSEPVHFLQIWILPEARGLPPRYAQRAFPAPEREGRLRRVASRSDADGSLVIHQDADLYVATLEPGAEVAHRLRPGRHAWVQVARGAVRLGSTPLRAGDGAALSEESDLRLKADAPAEILLFDLP